MKKTRESGGRPEKPLTESERAELIRLREEVKVARMEAEFAKNSSDLVREGAAVKYAAIANWAATDAYPWRSCANSWACPGRATTLGWVGPPWRGRCRTNG